MGLNVQSELSRLTLCVAIIVCAAELARHVECQVTESVARNIMHNNFLGPDEVARHFGTRLTEQQLKEVREIRFSEKTLRECSNSHILFLGVRRDDTGHPLTIRRLRERFPAGGQPCFKSYPRPSEPRQAYADDETPQLRWYLIARSLREESREKPYWQHERLLKENEYRERAVVYVYMTLLVFKARGERLFENDVISSNDVGPDGAPVIVGYFGPDGVYVSDWWLRPDIHFGIAPARKPDLPSNASDSGTRSQ